MQIELVSVYQSSYICTRYLCAKWHLPTTICSQGAVSQPTNGHQHPSLSIDDI